jgi:hypothetical protein
MDSAATPVAAGSSLRSQVALLLNQTVRFLLVTVIVSVPGAEMVGAQAWATKMFKETSHDFGGVARGAKTEFEFEITNIYEEELHIASVRSSCGCTTPRITKSNLKTWEKGAIVAQFNTRSFVGKKAAVVTVTIDKPYYAEVQLTVSGHIRSDIVVEPGEVQFGEVDQGAAKSKLLDVSYAGRSDWKIVDVRSQCEYLSVKMQRNAQSNGQVGYQLQIGLKENAPVGLLQQEIILVTNDAQYERVSIPVFANVMPPLTIAPSLLSLGEILPGETKQQRLVVRAKESFSITEIACDDERFTFKIPDGVKPVHLIPFEFVGTEATPGEFRQTVRVKTSLGEELTAECVISGSVTR